MAFGEAENTTTWKQLFGIFLIILRRGGRDEMNACSWWNGKRKKQNELDMILAIDKDMPGLLFWKKGS